MNGALAEVAFCTLSAGLVDRMAWYEFIVKNIKRFAAATAITTAGLGLAASGAITVAGAQPGPFPDYHWCPGDSWDQGWGNNWDWGRCHDDGYYDGEPRDQGHWHGENPWRPEGPGGPGRGPGPGGRGW